MGSPPAIDMLTCTLVKKSALLSRLHRILKHPSLRHLRSQLSLEMQMTFLLVQRVSRLKNIIAEFAALEEFKTRA
jgi:hypothetical protein